MRQFTVSPKVERDPEGREVVGQYSIIFDLVFPDQTIVESASGATIDRFPGRQQFLQDVKHILTSKFNCTILKAWESSNPESDSISVYLDLYCPISTDQSVLCEIVLKVSDHVNDDIFTQGHKRFVDKVSSHGPNIQIPVEDRSIEVGPEIYNRYHESLLSIEYEFGQIVQAISRKYNRR